MKKQLQTGFTLIELMIVITILAILVGVAYPAYLDQVRKSRRADCAGVLTGLAAAMERNFTERNTYLGMAGTNAVPANSGTPNPARYPGKCPIEGAATYYNLAIDPAPATTATTFVIRATPAGDQVRDGACAALTLTNTGIKGITGTGTVDRCW